MASAYETFKDLELTRDEVERITDALKNKEFRKLLTDYVEDVRNPDNQKIYQQEIAQLEKERGVDVTFINPEAGYVIKTSSNGSKKAFINICSNEHVQKPVSSPAVRDGSRGLQWSLPHTLAPPREDIDNKGARCIVYDVVFHNDTLHLAHKNKAFREMVNNTACNAVETNFNVTLDTKNLRFPKLQYKGYPQAAVIRKPSVEPPAQLTPEESEIMNKLYAQIDDSKTTVDYTKKRVAPKNDNKSPYTTPQYVVKHSRTYEIDEFSEHKHAKLNTTIPKELVVEIALPLLKSSSDIVLDVAEKSLQLISEKPARYKLSLTLPYYVNEDSGNAKFDKDKKKLVVTLPVKNRTFSQLSDKEDSGVDSDNSPLPSSPLENDHNMETLLDSNNTVQATFLDTNINYALPEFTALRNEHDITFTVNVKNIDAASVKRIANSFEFRMKFISISSGFYPVHYALYLKFPSYINAGDVAIDVWDNNLTVQMHNAENFASYSYGADENDLTEKVFDVAEVAPEVQTSPVFKPFYSQKTRQAKASVSLSRPIDISGTSESSGDELSHSLSPGKSKGILKYIRTERRTVSESCVDDVRLAVSLENFTSVDSVIPEEGEISSSLKKTVRFNDVVSRQLFRSNSSILGQRKKNQRKAKAKKRAQERRHSESEVSETDEKKEREHETMNNHTDTSETKKSNDDFVESILNSEIFELDIN